MNPQEEINAGPKRILITGKDSYVGVSVKEYLGRWPERYSVDELDVRFDTWKDADFSGYDTVFHVAGLAHINIIEKNEQTRAKYFAINADLAEAVAAKAKAAGVKQFIQMSSMSIYGASGPIGTDKVITAGTAPAPADYYGESKLEAEARLRKLAGGGFRVVFVRPPMIYGTDCKGNYRTLRSIALKTPVFPKVGNARSMIYIKNFAEFIRQAVDRRAEGVFFPANREILPTYEIVRRIAAANGRKMLIIPGLNWALKLAAHITPLVSKAFGNMRYDPALTDAGFDYIRYTTPESIEDMEKVS